MTNYDCRTRKNQEIRLELLGDLYQLPLAERGIVKKPPHSPIILGHVADIGYCTLYQTNEIGSTHNSSGFCTTTYSVYMLLTGGCFNEESDLAFAAMSATHSSMEEWMRLRVFDRETATYSDKALTAGAKYRSFTEARYDVPELSASVELIPALSTSGEFHTLTWEHTAYLRVELTEDRSLKRYLSVLSDCRNLLTLFVGEPVRALKIIGERDEIEVSPDYRMKPQIPIYFSQGREAKPSGLSFFDMLVTYPAVAGRLGEIFRNWLTKAEVLRTVTDLYFGTIYHKSTFPRFKFLSLAQALESYGRPLYDPNEDERNIRKVFQPVIASLTPEAVRIVTCDREQFLTNLVNTRHYYTHNLRKYEAGALKEIELYKFNERLRLLLTILLLKEAGLDEPLVVKLLGENNRLMMWLHLYPDGPLPLVEAPSPPGVASSIATGGDS